MIFEVLGMVFAAVLAVFAGGVALAYFCFWAESLEGETDGQV
jgi:hypothetical protein